MSRFEFRQVFAEDTGASGGAVTIGQFPESLQNLLTKRQEKKSKPYVLRKGGQDEIILRVLRECKGKMKLAEVAALIPKRNGEAMKVSSLSTTISKLKGYFERKGRGDDFKALYPSDYTGERQGRRLAAGGTSHSACADTWWRTDATAAGLTPQASHNAAPSASWLTPKAAAVLHRLLLQPGLLVSRRALLDEVWLVHDALPDRAARRDHRSYAHRLGKPPLAVPLGRARRQAFPRERPRRVGGLPRPRSSSLFRCLSVRRERLLHQAARAWPVRAAGT